MRTKSPIYVVIRDRSLRRLVVETLRARKTQVVPFASGADFLDAAQYLDPGVAVVDLELQDMAGLTVLQELKAVRRDIAVIITAGDVEIRVAVQAIKKGADDFLEQPFDVEGLIETLASTAANLQQRVELQMKADRASICLGKLSKREHDVLMALDQLQDNEAVAQALNLTVRTVETYRSRIMRKCETSRFNDALALCRAADLESSPPPKSPARK